MARFAIPSKLLNSPFLEENSIFLIMFLALYNDWMKLQRKNRANMMLLVDLDMVLIHWEQSIAMKWLCKSFLCVLRYFTFYKYLVSFNISKYSLVIAYKLVIIVSKCLCFLIWFFFPISSSIFSTIYIDCRVMQTDTSDILVLSYLFRWTSMYAFLSVYTRKDMDYLFVP